MLSMHQRVAAKNFLSNTGFRPAADAGHAVPHAPGNRGVPLPRVLRGRPAQRRRRGGRHLARLAPARGGRQIWLCPLHLLPLTCPHLGLGTGVLGADPQLVSLLCFKGCNARALFTDATPSFAHRMQQAWRCAVPQHLPACTELPGPGRESSTLNPNTLEPAARSASARWHCSMWRGGRPWRRAQRPSSTPWRRSSCSGSTCAPPAQLHLPCLTNNTSDRTVRRTCHAWAQDATTPSHAGCYMASNVQKMACM